MLDIGKRYAPRDERDPWRRMPGLFDAAVQSFGPTLHQRAGEQRAFVEGRIALYCERARELYPGPCPEERSRACQGFLQEAVEGAREGRDRRGWFWHLIEELGDDDRVFDMLRSTKPPQEIGPGFPQPDYSLILTPQEFLDRLP